MGKSAGCIDAEVLKRQAAGRWPAILSSLGGAALEILDGKNHPCPMCGGDDRFRMIDAEAGGSFATSVSITTTAMA